MKILKIAAIVVGTVALVATGVGAFAAAAGIATTVAAGASAATAAFFATAATVASIATIASIGIGLASLAVGASAKPPPVGGNQTDFRADPQAGVPYAMGRTAYAGNVVARDTYGNNNEIQGIVTVLSGGGPIDSIESFSVDNAATTFGTGGNAVGEFHDFMWFHSQLGACPEASALTPSQGTLPGWDSSSKTSGLAAFLWELKFDKKGKHYAGGLPSPLTVLKGVRVYDPRLDSTYPGGSGSCRPLVESTYVWSENPWLHALTFALGRFQNGKRVMGCGMPVASIDVGAFVEAANVADANGWTTGGVVFSTDDKWGVLKALAQAGGGEVMQLSARLSCLVNTPRVSLATITRDDIVGRASVTGTQARRDRINGVTPRIRSESHGWEVVPLDIVRGDTYLDEDGAERTREIDYQLVQDGDQAAKLAAYDIANAREFGPITLPLKPIWMGYKPGDCLTVNDPELGLTSQPCINLTRDLELASGICTLTLRSETTAKHAWALGQTGTAPPTPGLSAPDFTVAAPVEDSWALAAIALAGTSGESVPVLRVTGAVDNPNAEAVQFEYRLDGDEDWHFAGLAGPDTTAFDIGSIIPGAAYEVAVSYEVRGVKGDRLVLGPVTAPALSVLVEGGISSAQVFIYQRSATAPTLPSATATYTFATGALTGLNNGWTRTIPAGSNPLYVSLATAAAPDPTDDIAASEWAAPIVMAQDGSGGVNSATIFLYQRNSTGVAPSVPSATVTYTFATAGLTGVNNGWSATVPAASGGTFLWVTTASALGTGATDTIATGEWATVRVMAQDGATGSTGSTGASGQNTAAVYLYQRATSSPALPSSTLTYTFATGALSGTLGSWTQGVPTTNGLPLWVTVATATGTGSTDTIANTEWASPVTMVQDGTNSASIFLYQRNSTGISPSVPSVLTTYTFSTGVLASINNGWSQTIPDTSGGTYLWVTTATALATTTTDTIATGEWATPHVMAQNGDVGVAGANAAIVYLYQRASSTPSTPAGSTTYTFASGVLSGTITPWSQTIPADNGLPLYVTTATATGNSTTDTIASGEWASPVVLTQTGTNGLNTATVYLFQRSASAPSAPVSTSTYTFATGILAGSLGSWTQAVPSGSNPLYVTLATALSTGATDTIAASEWATPVIMAQDGAPGANAKIVDLSADTDVFKFNTAGVLTPSGQTVTVTATAANLTDGAVVFTYSDNLGTASATLATAYATTPGAGQRAISDPFTSTPTRTWLKVTATGQGVESGLSDSVTLYRLQDGSNALAVTMSNEAHTVPALSDGSSPDLSGANGTITVYYGTTDVTSSVTFSEVTETNCSGDINVTTNSSFTGARGAYRVTAITADTATYRIGVSYNPGNGAMSANKDFTVSKSKTGTAGANGVNTAPVFLYQRAASTPSVPGSTLTYTFASGALSGTLGSWTQYVPSGTDPLYVTSAVASGSGSTDTIATGEWAAPVVMAQNGATGSAGLNSATAYLYKRGTSAPAVPSGTLTWTFATGILSGTLSGWTQSVPSGTDPLYVTTAAALGTSATDTIATGEWATPAVIAQNGAQIISAYRRGIVQPSTPTGNGTPTGWSATPIADAGDFLPVTSSGMVTNADYSSFEKTSGTIDTWDQSFRSTSGGIGMAVGFRVVMANKRLMVGLNTDPTTNDSYTSLDYAVYCDNTGNAWAVKDGDTVSMTSLGTYAADDAWTVEHRDTTVVITKNGTVSKTWTGVSSTAVFYADSSFGDSGAKISAVFVTNGDLWISQAVQDLAGVTSGSWSTPIQFTASDAANGNFRDIKFKRSLAQPATPTGDTPSGWSDGVPAGTETLWMSVVLKSFAGAALGAWSTPQSLSGQTPRGDYSSTATYYVANTVFYNGGTYFASQDNFSGHAPSGTGQANAYWDVASAPGPPGTPAVPPSAFSATINLVNSTGTVNLRSIADANGYTGNSDATVTFNVPSGVTITGLSGGGVAIDSGSWPVSSYSITITLVVQSGGTVYGGGGIGGPGGSTGNGETGGDGGDAVFCRLPMTVTVDSGGTLKSGGGGGGGGGAKVRYLSGELVSNGGSGGGGGFPNGVGGVAGSDSTIGNNGSAGTTGGGGSGGSAVSGGGAGGAGGGAGASGSVGSDSSNATGSGGGAGVAGYAVRKNGNTVSTSGTMTGTVG